MRASSLPAALLTAAVGRSPVKVGASKLGGYPDLPTSVPWPTVPVDVAPFRRHLSRLERSRPDEPPDVEQWEADAAALRDIVALGGRPLAFLGQINFGDVPVGTGEYPREGLVAFFYDYEDQPWGFDPAHKSGCRVLYVPRPARRTDRVNGGSAGRAPFRECSVAITEVETISSTPSANAPESLWEPYNEAFWKVRAHLPTPAHWTGGNPLPQQQNNMALECQLVSNGLYCGDSTGFRDPRRKTLEAGAADWVLLLQLDTDEQGPGWIWGDSGSLYFWVRRPDLARLDFSNVWCVLQCG